MHPLARPRSRRLTVLTVLLALVLTTLTPLAPAAAHEGEHAAAHVLIFTETTQFRHTEAITQGTPVLEAAFAEAGLTSEHTEDSSIFNDEDLARFDALVMFQTSGDPWTADEKAALERYQQAGGGIVAIHNAADMRGSYAWWDELVGSLMPGHAATGTSPGLPGTVRVEDQVHPSTAHLPQRWDRADEWYNFSNNVRGTAHVLATMDESTYAPGSNAMGYDHPISWCKPYDGGRAWVTAMGHFGAHYTGEPDFVAHIVGGVEWAAGVAEGDCGGTVWGEFEKVPLDQNTSAPFGIDVAPDGRVFYSELVRGEIRVFDPATNRTSTAITIPVYSGGEDGLLDLAVAPDFAETGHLYVYHSPASSDDTDPANFFNRLSRFTVAADSTIDPASEAVIIDIPARRQPDEPGHTGGALGFDPDGNLLLSVGDDVNPHSEPSGGYAPLSTRPGTFHDARATSANTDDLRGKLLRITPNPGPEGGYTIPEGNMFPPGTEDTRPEIYAMGFRNPFRFSVDPATGAISLADYGPDATQPNANRGPAGTVSWMLIEEPGFYGWPLCHGGQAYLDVDYTTSTPTVGEPFDCDAPVNDSPRNTGLRELPPVVQPDLTYGYQRSTVPEVIPPGGGLAPMGGPIYRFDPESESDTKFPAYYDGKPFFYEWAKNRMYSIVVDEDAPAGEAIEKLNPFLPPPHEEFRAPIDSAFGPDGSLYVLDWGGGFGRHNPDSGLYRIDYVSGSRSPVAVGQATPDSGQPPLEVSFTSDGTHDPEGEELTYAWDLDGDGTVDATDPAPTFRYDTPGVYDARLTVTDPHGKTGTTTVPVTVGNTRPSVAFSWPPDGAFFEFGDELSWELTVTDPEDGEIADDDIVVQPALGHDLHSHPADPETGRTGSVTTGLGGHGEDTNVFYVLDARYEDGGGDGGIPALTGRDTVIVNPKRRQAEHHTDAQGVTAVASRDLEGGGEAVAGQDGAWFAFDPVNLVNIDALRLRVATATGGTVELRRDAPDGELLAAADVASTGGLSRYTDVTLEVTDPGDSFALYVVLPGAGERRVNFLEAVGKGASPHTRPEVRITAPAPDEALDPGVIEVVAEADDAEQEVTEVTFLVDGEPIGTDTQAPYAVDWEVTEEGLYALTAVATNDLGLTRTSRVVRAQVGELFGDFETFTNADATFDRPAPDRFVIDSGGANLWQATDEYGTMFLPAGADDAWTATVRIDAQGASHGSAKAGLVVRNDLTQPASSPGYAVLAMRPSGGFEWLRDTNGDGQLDASTSASTTGYPAWVRLVRSGDEYQALWSKDGETFTPIGGPVTLPGAAAVQDVGMIVTAHSATARSEVEFADFSLTDGAPDPDPEPGPGPVCEMRRSDEFDGALDTDRWRTVRQAPELPVRTEDGRLVLPVTGGDINEGGTGPISYVGQPVPEGAWEVTTSVTLDHSREWQHAGLMLHASDDDYVKLAFTRNSAGGRFLEFQTEAGGSRSWHASVDLPATFPTTVQLRLTVDEDGTVRAASSPDGSSWTDLAGATTVPADATVGLVAAGDTGAPQTAATVDWFRVTPDTEDDGQRSVSDEFDGDAVDGCRWDEVVRYDPSAVSLEHGWLSVRTQPGDINGTANQDPRNLLLQEVPEGDWVIETRLRAPLLHRWQLAGLLVYGDDDNYVKLDVVAANAPGTATDLRAELVSERDAQFGAGGNRNLDVADATESGWWHLRMARTGDRYEGWISADGHAWTSLGDPVTNDAPMRGFGLLAIGPEQEQAVTVDFDHFRLLSEQGPQDPPVVTATVDPEAPDGADGWYVSAVTVTLDADDPEAELAYRVDGGDWTDYDGPIVLDEDGEHVVEHRGTNAAGTSEVGTVVVRIDRTAGTSEAQVDGWQLPNGRYLGDVQVTVSGADATSGVARLEVRVDGGDWVRYDGPLTLRSSGAPTERIVEHRAVDAAGNVGEVRRTTFVQQGPPG